MHQSQSVTGGSQVPMTCGVLGWPCGRYLVMAVRQNLRRSAPMTGWRWGVRYVHCLLVMNCNKHVHVHLSQTQTHTDTLCSTHARTRAHTHTHTHTHTNFYQPYASTLKWLFILKLKLTDVLRTPITFVCNIYRSSNTSWMVKDWGDLTHALRKCTNWSRITAGTLIQSIVGNLKDFLVNWHSFSPDSSAGTI